MDGKELCCAYYTALSAVLESIKRNGLEKTLEDIRDVTSNRLQDIYSPVICYLVFEGCRKINKEFKGMK